jgi:hypothetical protein
MVTMRVPPRLRGKVVAGGVLALACGVVAALAAVWLHPGPVRHPRSQCPAPGFFVGTEEPSDATALGHQLGVAPKVLAIYAGAPNWTSFKPSYIPATNMQLALAVGRISRAEAQRIGAELVNAGQAHAIIRIMWEMNGNWFPWGTESLTASQYIRAFRAIELGFAAVPGQHFDFVWNLNAGSGGSNEFATYPGDAYVSNIGIDWYAKNGDSGAPASTIPPILAFAAAHHKPLSFDEWGVDGLANAGNYIAYVGGLVHNPANRFSFQIYFDNASSRITRYPGDLAAYRQAFSGAC